jgi:hypothetical protein
MSPIRPMAARIVAVAIAAAGLLGACSARTSADASPACGGFHLVVRNDRAETVAVRLNGVPSTSVAGGTKQIIFEYGPGGVSAMPWAVDVVDAATGAVLATREVNRDSGEGGASIVVQDAAGGVPSVGDVRPGTGC